LNTLFLPHNLLLFHNSLTKLFYSRLVVPLGSLLAIFSACSRYDMPAPVAEAPDARIVGAEHWFAQQPPLRAVPTGINWRQARAIGSWVVAPLADTTNFFAQEHKYGYRYLVVQTTDKQAVTGRIVELVQVGAPLSAEQAAQTALHLTQRMLVAPQSPASAAGLTGWAMVYSPAYTYETGFVYEQGVAQPKRVRLLLPGATGATTRTVIASKSAQASASIDDPMEACAMVQVCGYVNGDLSNCIYVEHCAGGTGAGGAPVPAAGVAEIAAGAVTIRKYSIMLKRKPLLLVIPEKS
jgi:hypothetical protein